MSSPRTPRHSSSTTPRSCSTAVGSSVAADSHCAEHVEPGRHDLVVVGGDRELVDGLVVAREGVDVGAELGAEPAQHVDQLVLGELLGAVEEHVLDEVGDARLVGLLVRRAGVDRQPQLGAAAGALVVPDVVA